MTIQRFRDYYNNTVRLSFRYYPFSDDPKHVWVICRFENQWLLTVHPKRGLEFPGGKVEEGELPEVAASREVFEETGATIQALHYIGQYEVYGKADKIIKNIYFAEIAMIERKNDYLETNGPMLINELPEQISDHSSFSFIMKDEVLTYSLQQIRQRFNMYLKS